MTPNDTETIKPSLSAAGAAGTSGSDRATAGAQAEVEALLDGAPPEDAGPRGTNSFRAWIVAAVGAGGWPDPATPIPNRYWLAVKELTPRLLAELCPSSDKGETAAFGAPRLRPRLESLLTFGAVYSLNYMERCDEDSDARTPRYDVDAATKADAARAVVHGWSPAEGEAPAPGMADLMLNNSRFAPGGIVSLKLFFSHIDYYFDTRRRGAAALRPAYLRRREGQPAVLAEDVWVRFMIRFHRREATIREAVTGILGIRNRLPQVADSRAISRAGRAEAGSNASGDGGGRKAFWALRGVSIAVHPGEVLGIVGRNGSGKTTLLKTLAGILGADRGRVAVRGRVGCLLSFGVGFNANLSGRENVYLNGSILGLSEREIDERLERIVAFSELGEFIHAPVRTYSAGMRGRLGFSIAIHIDPDVLILDEVLSVGDAYFRAKAGSIVDRFQQENKTVVIASHSMDLIRKSCTHAAWLDAGVIRMSGTPTDVTRAYVADCRSKRGNPADAGPAAVDSP